MKKEEFEFLKVEIYENRQEAGRAAGKAAASAIKKALAEKGSARVIFAAAPSQNEMLETLVAEPGIAWEKVAAFHMDEYLGLAADAPQRFARYLEEHLFAKVPFGEVHIISCPPGANPSKVCTDYAEKLAAAPVDVVCLGVGENGHLAFNDPPTDFHDDLWVKPVYLDEACRRQQVNDGCFPELAAVPRGAITLTIPALMAGGCIICTVPGARKRKAVHAMLFSGISEDIPASILRAHENATMYVDSESWEETS